MKVNLEERSKDGVNTSKSMFETKGPSLTISRKDYARNLSSFPEIFPSGEEKQR